MISPHSKESERFLSYQNSVMMVIEYTLFLLSNIPFLYHYRPGVANGAVGVGKSDGITQPTGPAFRSSIPKTEPDNPSLINDKRDRPMGSDKERLNQRAVNKYA